jgi:hypothetical protein
VSHEHKNDHEIKDKKRTGTHLKWQVYKQLFTREIVGVLIQQSKLWSYTQTRITLLQQAITLLAMVDALG